MSATGKPETALRVLVAEDESLAAMVIEDVLTEEGYSVMLAGDGQAALDLAADTRFDVLVTDLAMPRMTGWDLIPRLRAQRPDLPVVVMTGYMPPGGTEVLFAGQRGPLALLHKPFAMGQLVAALAGLLPSLPQALALETEAPT